MTVSSTTNRVSYPGAGSTGPFTFPFRILSTSDLIVTKRSAAGVESTLSYAADWVLSTGTAVGNATGSITLNTALAVGELISIRRSPSLTQPTSVQDAGTYFAKTHEDEWDRLLMQIQAVRDLVDRSLGVSESFDPATLSLRVKPETGKVLVWQSSTELGNAELDSSAIALPGGGRTVPTVSAYLANNAVLNVKDFGAVGDGITDDFDAFELALNFAGPVGQNVGCTPQVYVPFGTYRLSAPLTLPKRVILCGDGGSGDGTNQAASILLFDDGNDGIIVPNSFATFSTIRDLQISAAGMSSGAANGITLQGRAFMENLHVSGFGGSGFYIVASSVPNGFNANAWRITNCRSEDNGAHGLYVSGTDANAGVANGLDCADNGGWGILDEGYLGNTYIGCQGQGNTLGQYCTSGGTSAAHAFLGCYSEGDQPASQIMAPAIVIGGLHGGGFTAASTAVIIGAADSTGFGLGLQIGAPGNTKSAIGADTVSRVGMTTKALGTGGNTEVRSDKVVGLAHGMTNVTETDTASFVGPISASGGRRDVGCSTSERAFEQDAYVTVEETTQTSTSDAPILLSIAKKNGAGTQALGATANMVIWYNYLAARFIFRADGTSFEHVGTAWTNFDDHNDRQLLQDLSVAVSQPGDPLRSKFLEFVRYNAKRLQELDLISIDPEVDAEDGSKRLERGIFVNTSKLGMLLVGATRQAFSQLETLSQRVEQLEQAQQPWWRRLFARDAQLVIRPRAV